MMDAHTIMKHPVSTEKALRLMESENKLTFVVDLKATKQDIKGAMETLFKVKVTKVRTLVTFKGKKKAYITLAKETPALDVATQLGLM